MMEGLGDVVEPGPEWHRKRNTTGTAVEKDVTEGFIAEILADNEAVVVFWDNGRMAAYIYSDDIKEVEKKPGAATKLISAGDRVKRGPDWKDDKNIDGRGLGTVVEVSMLPKQKGGAPSATVLWDVGTLRVHKWACE